jgi:acyl carrier protein
VDVKDIVRTFVLDNFLFGGDRERLQDDTPFIEERIIDSTGFIELIAFIETTFDITVDDMEMIPENLGSLVAIEHFVAAKTQRRWVCGDRPLRARSGL